MAVELASSIASVAMDRRLDIGLPGALRYLSRVYKAVRNALNICRGLRPDPLANLPPSITGFATLWPQWQVLNAAFASVRPR